MISGSQPPDPGVQTPGSGGLDHRNDVISWSQPPDPGVETLDLEVWTTEIS